MKRTKLSDRPLPAYSRGEELMNAVTHAVGVVLGIAALLLCLFRSAASGRTDGILPCLVYGISLTAMFAVSSVYHGMKPCLGKKVMQVIDHCTIYLLIAGTYTVIVLTALKPAFPELARGLFLFEWGLAALAVTLTAIDLKRFSIFSMVCYIGMGWAIIPFWHQVLSVLTEEGFLLLLLGGIAYTVGSVLYGIGKRRKWMHSIFHIFVILGAVLQFFSVLLYAL